MSSPRSAPGMDALVLIAAVIVAIVIASVVTGGPR